MPSLVRTRQMGWQIARNRMGTLDRLRDLHQICDLEVSHPTAGQLADRTWRIQRLSSAE